MAIGYDDVKNGLYVFGGRGTEGVIYNDTWYYDFDKENWSEVPIPTTPGQRPQNRFTMASGVYNGSMYISTGEGPGKVFYNDVWM